MKATYTFLQHKIKNEIPALVINVTEKWGGFF